MYYGTLVIDALNALRRANEWIIVGHSLPPEDVAIRSKFPRAYSDRDEAQQAPEIVLAQKEEKEPERTRYSLLLPKHIYRTEGLSSFLKSEGTEDNIKRCVR